MSLVVLLVCLSQSGPAVSAGRWRAVPPLRGASFFTERADVAAAATSQGTFLVAYTARDGIRVATGRTGHRLARPVTVPGSRAGVAPRLWVGDDGALLVAWSAFDGFHVDRDPDPRTGPDDCCVGVRYAVREPGGSWSPSFALAPAGRVVELDAATVAAGRFALVYRDTPAPGLPESPVPFVRLGKVAGGVVGPPLTVGARRGVARSVVLEPDGDVRVTVAADDQPEASAGLLSVRLDGTGAPGPPETVVDEDATNLQVSSDGRLIADVACERAALVMPVVPVHLELTQLRGPCAIASSPHGGELLATFSALGLGTQFAPPGRGLGGTGPGPSSHATDPIPGDGAAVAVADRGFAVLAFSVERADGEHDSQGVAATLRLRGGALTRSTPLASAVEDPRDLAAAIDVNGRALVALAGRTSVHVWWGDVAPGRR